MCKNFKIGELSMPSSKFDRCLPITLFKAGQQLAEKYLGA